MSESDCPEIPRFRMDNETRRRNDDDASLPRVFVLLFFFSVILLTHIYVCLSNRRAHISKLHGRTLHHQLAQVMVAMVNVVLNLANWFLNDIAMAWKDTLRLDV